MMSSRLTRRDLLMGSMAAVAFPSVAMGDDGVRDNYVTGIVPLPLKTVAALMPASLDGPLSAIWIVGMDASGSIDIREFDRQVEGTALMLDSDAMEEYLYCHGPLGLGTLQYGDTAVQGAGFGVIQTRDDAKRMADLICSYPKFEDGNTNLNQSIELGGYMAASCPYAVSSHGGRAVLVMGNGVDNIALPSGMKPSTLSVVQRQAVERGVSVSGVALTENILDHFSSEVATPEGLVWQANHQRVMSGEAWVAREKRDIARVLQRNLGCMVSESSPVLSPRDFG